MKKIKVRISKDPNGKGGYINKTAKFLKKARGGMQVNDLEIEDEILNQLTVTQDVDVIASMLEDQYGMDYFDALDQIENVVEGLYRQDVTATKDEMLNQDPDIDTPEIIKPKLYSTDEEWISDDNSGWDDFGEETEDAEGTSEDDDLAQEDQEALSLEKKGGTVNKKKFVKTVVTGLRKAAEGMQQDQSSDSSILDTPIGGRGAHVNNFRRGIKDLGNEFYAKKIYEETQKLQNQTSMLPPVPMGMPMAQEGFQVQEQDIENPMHHLQAYTGTVSDIFKQPMNQVHGAGFENLPEARRGREQRQADRQQRKMSKDWQNAFGDVAAGYFGVPGLPNYVQVISPQMVNPQANQTSENKSNPTGPFIDINYKKGPWWSGKREWSAKGIPAEMFMRSGMPGYGYVPGNAWSNSSSWSTSRSYPGEIIRTKSRVINAAADPSKTGITSSNTTTTTTNKTTTGDSPVIDNTGGKSTKATEGAIYKHPEATDTYLIMMSDGAMIQKIGDPNNPQPDDPVKARHTPEQAKQIINMLVPVGSKANQPTGLNNNPEENNTAQNLQENEYQQSFMDKMLDPENKMHATKFAFMNLQDPEELRQGNFNNYYFTDPKTGQTYMSDNYGTEFDTTKQTWNPVTLPAEQLGRLGHPIQHWDTDPNNPEGSPIYSPEKTKWLKPNDWLQYEYDWNKDTGNPFDPDKYYETNYPEEFGKLIRAYGGPVNNPQMDPYGNLQRFVYGGGDMGVSPIVAYENNDINSKNTDDPFMFRQGGGLYKFEGEDDSQVGNNYTVTNPPAATPVNQYQSPAFQQHNQNATAASNFAAFTEMKKRGLVTGNYDPTKSYDMSNANKTTTTTTNTQTQNQTQGGNYPQGYPTAPSLKEQILDKFMPFKKNKETGKYYDFMWASQRGPATTLDGKPYQVPGQPGATTNQTQTQTQTQGEAQPNAQGQPAKPGYYYDYKFEKGPWWKGNKQTMSLTGRWIDPNNPNAGKTPSANPFADGKGPTLDPNAATNTNTSTTTNPTTTVSPTTTTVDNKGVQPNGTRYVEGMSIGKNQMLQTNTDAEGNPMGIDSKGRLVNAGGPDRGQGWQDIKNSFSNIKNMFSGKRYEEGGYIPEYMSYGGYMPTFNPGGQFSGTGPFDPNDTGIAGGGTGPCTEDQVKNAQPGDPCYNEDYMKSLTPQDFTVDYDLKKARTLDFGNIGNIQMGAMALGTGLGNTMSNMYNEEYLASRTDSGNREAVNYNETAGGYDAQGQRIMGKTQGRGAKGFNKVVGTGSFTKMGGQLKYEKGGEYDLTQEEIGQILAAGGQIKFIK